MLTLRTEPTLRPPIARLDCHCPQRKANAIGRTPRPTDIQPSSSLPIITTGHACQPFTLFIGQLDRSRRPRLVSQHAKVAYHIDLHPPERPPLASASTPARLLLPID